MAQKMLEERITLPKNAVANFLKIFVTFQLVCLAWIFFRADSLSSAIGILSSIGTLKSGTPFMPIGVTILLTVSVGLHFIKARFPVYEFFMSLPYPVRYFAYSVGIFLLFFNKTSVSSQFIYFQF